MLLGLPSLSAGTSLTHFLQGVSKHKAGKTSSLLPASTTTGTASALSSITGNSGIAGQGTTGTQSGSQTGNAGLFSQIQQTVVNALQSAKTTGSTKDPNQIVEDSIASLLKNIFSGKASPSGPPSTPALQQAFQSALKNAGVSQQQFQADFKAAVEDAQSGSTGSPPTGTTLDVTG